MASSDSISSDGEVSSDSEIASSSYSISIRVAYQETDGQRRVHHANYLNYFERARVEMLRNAGISYKQIEDDGIRLVVTEMNIQYFAAAEFDDVLTLVTNVVQIKPVRIRHHYRLMRGSERIVEATSTIAAIDSDGKPTRLPSSIRNRFHR